MLVYLKLIRFLKPYIPLFVLAVIAMLVLAATTAVYSYLVGPLLKFIFTGTDAGNNTLFDLSEYSSPMPEDESRKK